MSTKLDSLKSHISDGIQRKQQDLVLFLLTTATGWQWKMSRDQIVACSGISITSACARINELVKAGKVRIAGTKVAASGKTVHTYAAVIVRPVLPPQQGIMPCETNC